MSTELPWDDCKVAFGIDKFERFDKWLDRLEANRTIPWPKGWEFDEFTDEGARAVVVFRVNVELTRKDGETMLKILKRFQ